MERYQSYGVGIEIEVAESNDGNQRGGQDAAQDDEGEDAPLLRQQHSVLSALLRGLKSPWSQT